MIVVIVIVSLIKLQRREEVEEESSANNMVITDEQRRLCSFNEAPTGGDYQLNRGSFVFNEEKTVGASLSGYIHHDFNEKKRDFNHVYLPLTIDSLSIQKLDDTKFNLTLKHSICVDITFQFQFNSRKVHELTNINVRLKDIDSESPASSSSSSCDIDYPDIKVRDNSLVVKEFTKYRCLFKTNTDSNQMAHIALVTLKLFSLEIKLNHL